jgi:hypothetical protein
LEQVAILNSEARVSLDKLMLKQRYEGGGRKTHIALGNIFPRGGKSQYKTLKAKTSKISCGCSYSLK